MALKPNQVLHVCFCLPKSLHNQEMGGKVVCFLIKESLFIEDASKMNHSLRHPDGENSSVWKPAVFASNVLGNCVASKELFHIEMNVYSLLCFKILTCYIEILSNFYSSVWVWGFSLFVLGRLFCLFGFFLTKKNKPTKKS